MVPPVISPPVTLFAALAEGDGVQRMAGVVDDNAITDAGADEDLSKGTRLEFKPLGGVKVEVGTAITRLLVSNISNFALLQSDPEPSEIRTK